MVNALGAYVQSVFANPMSAISSMMNAPAPITSGQTNSGSSAAQSTGSSTGSTPSLTGSSEPTTVGFYFRGSLVPLVQIFQPLTPKPQL